MKNPAFIIDLSKLEENLKTLAKLKQQADCQIVLALKAYALWHTFPLIGQYLDGCCASGLHEARLSHQEMKKATLTYSPAYLPEEITELMEISTHLDFNSIQQWKNYRKQALAHPRHKAGDLHYGLRINPQYSTTSTEKYDPCSKNSRLGIISEELKDQDLTGISGLHFHTLCEQYTEDLEKTLEVVEQRFGFLLKRKEIRWLNMGGGHWITKPDYDRNKLITLIKKIKTAYDLEEIWLEPGEAVAIHTGILTTKVLDIVKTSNGSKAAILNVSATAHMPDTLEMPYRPDLFIKKGKPAGEAHKKNHNYIIGGPTCLAGDTLGIYSFDEELKIGDELYFDDMAHYTMVKTTTFNGVQHPSIYLKKDEHHKLVREFNYTDFKNRLG